MIIYFVNFTVYMIPVNSTILTFLYYTQQIITGTDE
jgi:hypothetical protein